MRVKIRVKGIVQGVGFRPFVYRIAQKNQLTGYIRNRGDAGVEILVEGLKQNIDSFLANLQKNKPPQSRIYEVITENLTGDNQHEKFLIIQSSSEAELSGSVIPPDIAICNECLKEVRSPENRRFEYFFITCTDCGPRYTIIEGLPYDRERTTMRSFPMCETCRKEYTDPTDRRFHAQTIACRKCGPKVYLTANNGDPVGVKDPIREAGKLLSEGFIVAIKGYGGFHVAASTVKDEPLIRLRNAKHRRQKPFAIMAPSIEATERFAEVSSAEKELLTSHMRPIVLLKKSRNYFLSNLVAPGLHNVGVMLPYTGLHYMLFDRVDEPAFVMTSANPSNQPIIKDDQEALQQLGAIVDYFLFHDRQVAFRCDDSVVRVHGKNTVFLRRSRGYAPAPIVLRYKSKSCTIGLGGELNNTACVLLGDKAFVSQHVGDVENLETKNFLKESVLHLVRLTNCKAEAIACDLHPKFTTTMLARELAQENGWQLVQVQHHHAHIAALMAEHNVQEVVGVCCDGYGYGLDGEAWGGEILYCEQEPKFERLAHLQKQPLVGGDLATYYPVRMAAGILRHEIDIEKWLWTQREVLPYGEKEAEIILNQLKSGKNMHWTSSCGRVLDAVAAVLCVCYERTYEGEPAMKLESLAAKGKNTLNIKPLFEGKTLNTSYLVKEIFVNKEKTARKNLARAAHEYLAEGLAMLAIEQAQKKGVKHIGFSGGVACNELIASEIRRIVEDSSLRLLVHKDVPPGDGGTSLGQAVVAGYERH
ncbi:carbamoyltransferase HypF [Candidatus Bathyarchaeota archaeon]|nr:carbamoyltransferase HypF [Candidatus Bathyarchaeota archaeon]